MTAHATISDRVSCVNCGTASSELRELIRTVVKHKGRFRGQPLTIVTCPRCGLVFQNPRPTPEQLHLFYTHDYYQGRTTSAKRSDADEKLVLMELQHRWLTRRLPDLRDRDILDVGAGYGQWLGLFDEGNRVLGIESSQQAIAAAREWYGIEMRNVDFLGADLEPRSVDLVTGLAIIEHFLDPLEALVAANRVLRPEGHLYLYTPDYFGLVLRAGVPKYFKIVHTYYFSEATLSSLLRKAGFDVVASERVPPLLETSTLVHRKNFLDGRLQVLARKREETSLEEARQRPHSGDEVETVFRALDEARRRDRLHEGLSRLRKGSPAAPFVRAALALVSLAVGKPRSKYEILKQQLGA